MNDKRDLQLAVTPMIEWCARYWNLTQDNELTNWEIYIWDRVVAYNYNVVDAYIVKYSATWSFPHEYKLEISFNHLKGTYKLTKKYV